MLHDTDLQKWMRQGLHQQLVQFGLDTNDWQISHSPRPGAWKLIHCDGDLELTGHYRLDRTSEGLHWKWISLEFGYEFKDSERNWPREA